MKKYKELEIVVESAVDVITTSSESVESEIIPLGGGNSPVNYDELYEQ